MQSLDTVAISIRVRWTRVTGVLELRRSRVPTLMVVGWMDESSSTQTYLDVSVGGRHGASQECVWTPGNL